MAKAPADIRSLARSHCKKAIQVLGGLLACEDVPPDTRIRAATVLLERGYGKPDSTLNLGAGSDLIELMKAIDGRSRATD